MSKKAREQVIGAARMIAERHGIKFWTVAMFDLIDVAEDSYAAGVAEGIRQAREAVVGVSFWEEADAVAVEDALDALDAIDNINERTN